MAGFSGKFLTGSDQFTLADLALYFSCNSLETFNKYFKFEDYPHLKSWYQRVAEALKQYDPEGKIAAELQMIKEFVQKRMAETGKQ